MKTIMVDCNSVHEENGEIYLSEADVRFFNLCDGMSVKAYDGDEVWNAIVYKFVSANGCEKWYVKLCDLNVTLDEKQREWSSIGFMNGVCCGEVREKSTIIQRMIDLGYGFDEIDKIVDMNTEIRSQCKEFFDKR